MTYIREFETIEALVTVLKSSRDYSFRLQRYNKDYTLTPTTLNLCTPKSFDLDEYISTNKLCKFIEKEFNLSNCYDLNDWDEI